MPASNKSFSQIPILPKASGAAHEICLDGNFFDAAEFLEVLLQFSDGRLPAQSSDEHLSRVILIFGRIDRVAS